MGYYLMRLNRRSSIDVLVKADTRMRAEKDLDDWLSSGDDADDIHDLMNEREQDSKEFRRYFSTIEQYNRVNKMADFEIDMRADEPPETEPKYDLYLIIDEEPCKFHHKVWEGITMESVLNILKEYNKQYILKTTAAAYECLTNALNRGCSAICYKLTKRKD